MEGETGFFFKTQVNFVDWSKKRVVGTFLEDIRFSYFF